MRTSGLRELERRLQIDEGLQTICGITRKEPAYGRSVLSRFNQRLDTRRLRRIVSEQLKKFAHRRIDGVRTVAFTATFKAHARAVLTGAMNVSRTQTTSD